MLSQPSHDIRSHWILAGSEGREPQPKYYVAPGSCFSVSLTTSWHHLSPPCRPRLPSPIRPESWLIWPWMDEYYHSLLTEWPKWTSWMGINGGWITAGRQAGRPECIHDVARARVTNPHWATPCGSIERIPWMPSRVPSALQVLLMLSIWRTYSSLLFQILSFSHPPLLLSFVWSCPCFSYASPYLHPSRHHGP